MFSWDVAKALKNFKKHGISFEEASTVLVDSRGLGWLDLEHSEDELRFKFLGTSSNGRVLIVVYTIRIANDKETIRIISARPADRKERQAYSG